MREARLLSLRLSTVSTLLKGYPEFDVNQLRDEGGRWSGEGGVMPVRSGGIGTGSRSGGRSGRTGTGSVEQIGGRLNRIFGQMTGSIRSLNSKAAVKSRLDGLVAAARDVTKDLEKLSKADAIALSRAVRARTGAKTKKDAIRAIRNEVIGRALQAQRVWTAGRTRPW